MDQLQVRLRDGSRHDSEELATAISGWLDEGDVVLEGEHDDYALDPVTVWIVVTGAVVAVGLITRIVDWVRERNNCLIVIDATGERIDIREDCDVQAMRGKIVILTVEGQELRIDRGPDTVDVEKVVTMAMETTVSAALELLKDSGGEGAVAESGRGFG